MGLWDMFSGKSKNPQKLEKESALGLSGQISKVADELDQLSYFKYVDPSNLEYVKAETARRLLEGPCLAGVLAPAPDLKQLDPRHFILDGEDLFEEGGITDSLEEMRPFFDRLNIQMAISDHMEEYKSEDEGLNHEITINGKRYVLFRNFTGYGWGEAAQRFADMVNDQLALQGSDDWLYLINGGNDGRAVFLKEELCALAARYIKDVPRERPLNTKEWCRVNGIRYQGIT